MRRAVSWLYLAVAIVALLAGTGELSRLHPDPPQVTSSSLLKSQPHRTSNAAISSRNLQQVSTAAATASASAQAPASDPSGLTLVVFQQVSLAAFCTGVEVWPPGLPAQGNIKLWRHCHTEITPCQHVAHGQGVSGHWQCEPDNCNASGPGLPKACRCSSHMWVSASTRRCDLVGWVSTVAVLMHSHLTCFAWASPWAASCAGKQQLPLSSLCWPTEPCPPHTFLLCSFCISCHAADQQQSRPPAAHVQHLHQQQRCLADPGRCAGHERILPPHLWLLQVCVQLSCVRRGRLVQAAGPPGAAPVHGWRDQLHRARPGGRPCTCDSAARRLHYSSNWGGVGLMWTACSRVFGHPAADGISTSYHNQMH